MNVIPTHPVLDRDNSRRSENAYKYFERVRFESMHKKKRPQARQYYRIDILTSSLTIARILEYGTGSVASRHFWNSRTYLFWHTVGRCHRKALSGNRSKHYGNMTIGLGLQTKAGCVIDAKERGAYRLLSQPHPKAKGEVQCNKDTARER